MASSWRILLSITGTAALAFGIAHRQGGGGWYVAALALCGVMLGLMIHEADPGDDDPYVRNRGMSGVYTGRRVCGSCNGTSMSSRGYPCRECYGRGARIELRKLCAECDATGKVGDYPTGPGTVTLGSKVCPVCRGASYVVVAVKTPHT